VWGGTGRNPSQVTLRIRPPAHEDAVEMCPTFSTRRPQPSRKPLPAKAAHPTLSGCFVFGALFALVVLGEVLVQSQWIDRRRTVAGSAYHAAGRIVLTAMMLLIVGGAVSPAP